MDEGDDSGNACGSDFGSPRSGSSAADGCFLNGTLSGDALARSLVDAVTANELCLVRSEVGRLRQKIKSMDRERDNMVDNFRDTMKIMLNRIKELETELSETKSRPQTAVIVDRIENPTRTGRESRTPAGTIDGPQILRIDEDGDDAEVSAAPVEEVSRCPNCDKDIPAGNIISHNLYCYSNNFRCTVCDEVLHIREREAHLRDWTDPVRLIDAAARRDTEVVQRIAEHNADLNTASHPKSCDTVTHVAARLGDVDLIGFFIACGVQDVNPVNSRGETPLHLAAQVAGLPAAKLLVELGADLNVTNANGETALLLVCRRGAAQTAKYLVEMKADAEACTKLGDTPLQVAQRGGHQETVMALCMAGAPLRPGTPSRSRGASPMHRQPPTPTRPPTGGYGQPSGGSGTATGGYPPPLPASRRSAPSPKRSLALHDEGRGHLR
mmetsp:Transcript_50417/g.100295  ORF Transcript_50417/g.100295 Transcript_50417/m.100295 type:complete len:440 (-) Transcript_50417:48-1367(-)